MLKTQFAHLGLDGFKVPQSAFCPTCLCRSCSQMCGRTSLSDTVRTGEDVLVMMSSKQSALQDGTSQYEGNFLM